ncbi:MAG TPA: Asd/ArgC dimerization domain-containing protein [Terriglobia bacterium]|nr:Asd/ArgC dimerization domain-containing protein [Terriglobia bacterium]
MKKAGYHVAVIGASSLPGKELLTVLEERHFPVAELISVSGEPGEPDLPILDLSLGRRGAADYREEIPTDFDFAFVAAPHPQLASWIEGAGRERSSSRRLRVVIDLGSGLPQESPAAPRVPFLDGPSAAAPEPAAGKGFRRVTAPHAAALMISALLVRLAARFRVRQAVAQVFSPASEMGSRAIEELQKQTVNLLSFQKVPREVYGAQIAFNLLPRLGAGYERVDAMESRVRDQLAAYLGSRSPVPALRLFQVPVFYSTALSLYVETEERVPPSDLVLALDGMPVAIRRSSEKPPSQADVAGSNDILVDAIQPDAAHPEGIWFWAVADNMRLEATNAVQIAEGLHRRRQPLQLLK